VYNFGQNKWREESKITVEHAYPRTLRYQSFRRTIIRITWGGQIIKNTGQNTHLLKKLYPVIKLKILFMTLIKCNTHCNIIGSDDSLQCRGKL